MCLLAVLFRVVDDAPVVIGANREEVYQRGGSVPDRHAGPVPFVAGLDPVAGGTWLGVNALGLVIAITNRPKIDVPDSPRSRGLLVRDLLALGSAREARDAALAALQQSTYAGCNLLMADHLDAIVIHAGDWLRIQPLPPGAHVLADGDVNRPGDPRISESLHRLRARDFVDGTDAVAELRRLCSRSDSPSPIVRRGPDAGTVSSTILALRDPLARSELYHAQGPPDRVPYQDCSDLLVALGEES